MFGLNELKLLIVSMDLKFCLILFFLIICVVKGDLIILMNFLVVVIKFFNFCFIMFIVKVNLNSLIGNDCFLRSNFNMEVFLFK